MTEYVITLVHGTWAPDAQWTLEGSRFRQTLEDGLEPAPGHFSIFNWSGKNDLVARRQAAAALLRHLRQLLRRYPKGRHYVISHSHGGNISFLAYPRLQQRLSGLICLSTPFVHVQERRFPAGTEEAFMIGVTGWVFVSWCFLSYWLFDLVRPIFSMISDVNFAYLYLISGGLLVGITVIMLQRGLAIWRKNLSRAFRHFRIPDVKNDHVLIIRAAGDEASALLGSARLWSWLLSRMAGFTAEVSQRDISRKMAAIRSRSILVMLLSQFLLIVGIWLRHKTGQVWPEAVTTIGGVGSLAALLVFFLPHLIQMTAPAFMAPAFLLLAFIMRAAYGRGAALVAAGLEITAEATPPGNWSSTIVDTGGGFAHSSYQDPLAGC